MNDIEGLAKKYFRIASELEIAEAECEGTFSEWKDAILSLPMGTPMPKARKYPNTAKLLDLVATPPTE